MVLKFFKPGPVVIEVVDDQSPEGSESTPLLQRKTSRKEIHSPSFDFGLARVSLIIELIISTAMALSISALSFTIFGMLGALGVAFGPATQSVTLALYSRRGGKDVGRLFGALSVVQALWYVSLSFHRKWRLNLCAAARLLDLLCMASSM